MDACAYEQPEDGDAYAGQYEVDASAYTGQYEVDASAYAQEGEEEEEEEDGDDAMGRYEVTPLDSTRRTNIYLLTVPINLSTKFPVLLITTLDTLLI